MKDLKIELKATSNGFEETIEISKQLIETCLLYGFDRMNPIFKGLMEKIEAESNRLKLEEIRKSQDKATKVETKKEEKVEAKKEEVVEAKEEKEVKAETKKTTKKSTKK